MARPAVYIIRCNNLYLYSYSSVTSREFAVFPLISLISLAHSMLSDICTANIFLLKEIKFKIEHNLGQRIFRAN